LATLSYCKKRLSLETCKEGDVKLKNN